MKIYQYKSQEALKKLETSLNGLGIGQAQERLDTLGPNRIVIKRRGQLLMKLVEPFRNLFVLILLIVAGVSFVSHEYLDTTVVLVIVIVNAFIYYFQRFSADRVLALLQKTDPHTVPVKRAGKISRISADTVTIGDIVLLHEGMKLPADGRIVLAQDLKMNESILTGESKPVSKHTRPLQGEHPIYAQTNMAFRDTIVQQGNGTLLVSAIGNNTEFGKLALLSKATDTTSPLQHKINKLTSRLVIFVGVTVAITFVLSLWRQQTLAEAGRFVLSLAVSAIPEGLPIAVTIILVLGTKTMAKRKALVRNLTAIETLGQTTLIATDKTGTITNNKLHIAQTWSPAKNDIEYIAAMTKSTEEGSSTDEIERLFEKEFRQIIIKNQLIKRIPFVQKLRLSGSIWKIAGKDWIYIKGAPETIIAASSLTRAQLTQAKHHLHQFSQDGLRVVGLARKESTDTKINLTALKGFEFCGFLAFGDSLRPRVQAAVEAAHQAGIDVVLMTGDHVATATYFGKQSGIATKALALEGSYITSLDNAEIRHSIKSTKVFGRVLPEHKYRILEALERSYITAMTGDGVNDVPALVKADVGIALGSGADAAKQAADMILLDNNFATIVEAIRYGRNIIINVRKMVSYLFATNLGEIITIVAALVIGLPLPITALQILWINLVTDTFAVVPLGLEPPEKDLMKSSPQIKSAPLLSRRHLLRIVAIAGIMATITIGIYVALIPSGLAYAQTMAFATLVVVQWANALNSRSEKHSFVEGFARPNWALVTGLLIAFGLQIFVMFGPLANVFNIQQIDTADVGMLVSAFVLMLISGDVIKRIIPLKPVMAV